MWKQTINERGWKISRDNKYILGKNDKPLKAKTIMNHLRYLEDALFNEKKLSEMQIKSLKERGFLE
jgi:hypothetical protein